MRKNNWILIAIATILSIFLLWLWKYLGFDKVHYLDLYLTIIWWVVMLVSCIAFVIIERIRREKMRNTYVGQGLLFNNGVGITRMDEGERKTSAIIRVLSDLDYDAHIEKVSDYTRNDDVQDRIRFDYIVRSKKFKDYGNVWEGEVIDLRKDKDPVSFSDREELVSLIEAQ